MLSKILGPFATKSAKERARERFEKAGGADMTDQELLDFLEYMPDLRPDEEAAVVSLMKETLRSRR